jgi:hypothetical protein
MCKFANRTSFSLSCCISVSPQRLLAWVSVRQSISYTVWTALYPCYSCRSLRPFDLVVVGMQQILNWILLAGSLLFYRSTSMPLCIDWIVLRMGMPCIIISKPCAACMDVQWNQPDAPTSPPHISPNSSLHGTACLRLPRIDVYHVNYTLVYPRRLELTVRMDRFFRHSLPIS